MIDDFDGLVVGGCWLWWLMVRRNRVNRAVFIRMGQPGASRKSNVKRHRNILNLDSEQVSVCQLHHAAQCKTPIKDQGRRHHNAIQIYSTDSCAIWDVGVCNANKCRVLCNFYEEKTEETCPEDYPPRIIE